MIINSHIQNLTTVLLPRSCIEGIADREAEVLRGVGGRVSVVLHAADGSCARRRVEERGREDERQEEEGEVQQGEEAERRQQRRPAPALHQGPHRHGHPDS